MIKCFTIRGDIFKMCGDGEMVTKISLFQNWNLIKQEYKYFVNTQPGQARTKKVIFCQKKHEFGL